MVALLVVASLYLLILAVVVLFVAGAATVNRGWDESNPRLLYLKREGKHAA